MTSSSIADTLAQPSLQQAVYRCVLNAVSYPGTIEDLCSVAEAPLSTESPEISSVSEYGALALLLATLVDESVSLADSSGMITPLQELLGCPSSQIENADFVVADGRQTCPDDFRPRIGDIYQPQLGATLILNCQGLSNANSESGLLTLTISGPGVPSQRTLHTKGLHASWMENRNRWVSKFPTGVDVILCDQRRVVCLPRTSLIKTVTVASPSIELVSD